MTSTTSYQIRWLPAGAGGPALNEKLETGPDRAWALRRCMSLKEQGVTYLEVTERRHLFNGPGADFSEGAFAATASPT